MKRTFNTLAATAAWILFLSGTAWGWQAQSTCRDVQERGVFNVLTVNLLYSETTDRAERFRTLVDFVQQQASLGEPVDIILLQEVVGGFLSGTQNSSVDLKKMLQDAGQTYNLRYCPVNDRLGILSEGTAILSRCRFLFTFAKTLSTVWETPSQGFELPLRRRAMMGRIHIPGKGSLHVFNIHLCAYCEPSDRLEQNRTLLQFVSEVEKIVFWDDAPVILGGDFNTDAATFDGQFPYQEILNAGFEDTFAAANGCETCCSDSEGGDGCTFSRPENPYVDDPPVRVDYIFSRDLAVEASRVVFGAAPGWVSDHSAVLSTIKLP